MKKTPGFARLTVSVPQELHHEINQLRQELDISQSELIKQACELLIKQQRKQQWQAAAKKMAPYYASDPELTAFNVLDSETFV
ncbi:MAG: CopG family transcriptional regulator [Candidatus Sericytochromatia bacterium]|nr:CopG family transcriptional regulator [Candidatus Sericytochromatia bacterium]